MLYWRKYFCLIETSLVGWADGTELDENGIAANVPSFLPMMLDEDELYEHKCTFEGSNMIDFVAVTLNENLSTE